MNFFIWCFLISFISTITCKRLISFIPGSGKMLFVIAVSGSLTTASLTGFGPNFWQGRLFYLPAVGAILAGSFLYLILWYIACLVFTSEATA